jgi:hypothetical protein
MAKESAGTIAANGGKTPEGVKFIKYSNPHGAGLPGAYDDTLSGIDSDIKETMSGIKKAFKPRRP